MELIIIKKIFLLLDFQMNFLSPFLSFFIQNNPLNYYYFITDLQKLVKINYNLFIKELLNRDTNELS
jgi:hypothetical protein